MSDGGDLTQRADDYERRLADAGGPDELINGLVAGLKRQRRFSFLLLFSLIADVVLSTALAFALWRIDNNADDITANTDSIGSVQDRTSNQVLCPLYTVFLSSVAHAPPLAADGDRDGTVTSDEQARYDAAVAVIRDGYTVLGCQPLLLTEAP